MQLQSILSSPFLRKWLNPQLLTTETIHNLSQIFSASSPFPHATIDNFFQETVIDKIIEELSQQSFYYKESDLFQLSQTDDFDNIDSPLLQELKSLFCSEEFLQLMSHITQIEQFNMVDMLGNVYTDTDHLLCHDDELLDRKIAFILYLTDLDELQGGCLTLFNSEDGRPTSVHKRIYPMINRLAFFKVTRNSFHEVEEVVGEDTYRVSISGWLKHDK